MIDVAKKILVVIGTRPEAIKMAPVVRELARYPEDFNVKICITAQHREMLDQVLLLFQLRPDFDLNLMRQKQDLFSLTSTILGGLKEVFLEDRPDLVLVHGDTTTTMAAALAAFYSRIPVGHVEAGLRTGNIYAPWPEEMNRKMAGALATIHFSPTEQARQNLLAEGVPAEKIYVTGNTVIDALQMAFEKIQQDNLESTLSRELGRTISCWPELTGPSPRRLILVTGHRRESFGDGFENICLALQEIAQKHQDVAIVYPVHLNPQVREPVFRLLAGIPSVHLVEPLDYLPFLWLMSRSHLILTDSGGIQEEAPSLGKPVLVMRDVTERSEGIDAGTVRLVGTSRAGIVSAVTELLNNHDSYRQMATACNPYGDGRAAKKIVAVLQEPL